MHIKAVDNRNYIFVPPFFVLKFRTNFTSNGKKFRVGSKKSRVGSPEPDIVFLFTIFV